jgi:hypothetical protein
MRDELALSVPTLRTNAILMGIPDEIHLSLKGVVVEGEQWPIEYNGGGREEK